MAVTLSVIITFILNDLSFSAVRTICAITEPSKSNCDSIRPFRRTTATSQLLLPLLVSFFLFSLYEKKKKNAMRKLRQTTT
jgi:hypothetical protein